MSKVFIATLFLEPSSKPSSYEDLWSGRCLELSTCFVLGNGLQETLEHVLRYTKSYLNTFVQRGQDLELSRCSQEVWEDVEAKVYSKVPCALFRIPILWPKISVRPQIDVSKIDVSKFSAPGWYAKTQVENRTLRSQVKTTTLDSVQFLDISLVQHTVQDKAKILHNHLDLDKTISDDDGV